MSEPIKKQVHNERDILARRNSISTLANQLVTMICGILIPRMMIGAFGSALYGATTSIAQFLSYISLLESGIGRAARSALYRPLAKKDMENVANVYYAIRRFFLGVAIIFILYTIVLAYFYFDIADLQGVTREYLFFLVIVISLSTVIDYLCGISNQTLLNADQSKYITNSAIIVTRILNTLLVLLLIHLGSGLIAVKLGSSLIIIIRPLFLSWYVNRKYSFKEIPHKKVALPQKWSGMAQHIAYFIHSNTDIMLLTVFSDLRLVAVYAIYSLIITSVRNLIFSMVGGMEAILGDMFAHGEQQALTKRYRKYQFITGMATLILMGVTGVMIVPFVSLYTRGVTDANYIQPLFALILTIAEAIDCLALPCSTIPVSANQLKQSQWGSIGEAIVNIGVSCALISWNPLLGVALGTLTAEVFKFTYYSVYAARNILHRESRESFVNGGIIVLIVLLFGLTGFRVKANAAIENYGVWVLWAMMMTVAAACIALLIGYICYRDETRAAIKQVLAILRHTH